MHERFFDAAYGGERVIAWLFLPKNARPPFQTVIYFPGSDSQLQRSSEQIENYIEFQLFLSFIVKNGRAVLYPACKGTFERSSAETVWPPADRGKNKGGVILDLMFEAFNLLNRTNYTQVDATFGPGAYPIEPLASFGLFTRAAPPFQAQLGVKLSFSR